MKQTTEKKSESPPDLCKSAYNSFFFYRECSLYILLKGYFLYSLTFNIVKPLSWVIPSLNDPPKRNIKTYVIPPPLPPPPMLYISANNALNESMKQCIQDLMCLQKT